MSLPEETKFYKIASHLVQKYGFAVFPLNGKVPMAGTNGNRDASKDLAVLKRWAQSYPQANVGVATGKRSGVVVIDLDSESALKQMDLPKNTFIVRSKRGWHYYFKYPNDYEIRNSQGQILEDVDVRGEGGHVVSPHSIHASGAVYTIENNAPFADLPKKLLEKIRVEEIVSSMTDSPKIKDPVKYAQTVLASCCRQVMCASEGTRNGTLNKASWQVARYFDSGLISETLAYDALLNAALTAGLKPKESELTIRSGFKEGRNKPRDLKADAPPFFFSGAPATVMTDMTDMAFLKDCCNNGEMGDAMLFCKLTDGYKLFDHTGKEWLTYIDGRWRQDLKQHTARECWQILRDAYFQAISNINIKAAALRNRPSDPEAAAEFDLQHGFDDDEFKRLEAQREKFAKRIALLGSNSRLSSILSLSKSMAGTLTIEFDADPMLLNLANGVYDFRAHCFRDHRPEDKITKRAHVYYDREADCPNWMMFIFDICENDEELVRYLQKIAGLMLTGRADYQYIFFFYGEGANGKSTFFTVIRMIMGEFLSTIPIDVLLSRQKNGTDEYHLARLKGARVATASEIPQGRKLNESLVKDLTSNDYITARNPYGNPFDFEPSHKLCLIGNHKPVITGMDHGIWRRVRIFPFKYIIPEEKKRPMDEVIFEFAQEKSGILNWMIEGYRMLEKEGLEMPKAVKDATEEYKNSSDSLGVFIDEHIELMKSVDWKVPLKQVWKKYSDWCTDNGEFPQFRSSRSLGDALRAKGFNIAKSTGNQTVVFGISIVNKEVG